MDWGVQVLGMKKSSKKCAMDWGVRNEATAIERYRSHGS